MSDFNLKVGTKVDTSNIEKQLNAKEYKVTATIVTKGGTEYEKTVRKLKDTGDGLYETTTMVNKATGETSTQLTKATKTVKDTSTAIQTASKHTKTLGEDFLSTAGKVAKFGAITSIIGLVTGAITEAVSSIKELDTSLTELKKVSDLSGEGLDSYTDKAFSMARDLSTTATNVTDATAQFVQAGYDLGESEGLSKYAIMLQSIADKTMDTETATGFLTTTIKSMNMTVGDAEHLISAVNEVSNQYAITSNDLSENIGKVAGVADVAGVSYEQLLGLMTSAVSRGSTASKSANAFKSLFINLQQMNSDGTMPKLSKQFGEFGIEMLDINGATKDAFQLLKELSVAYKEVSASTDVDKQNKMKTLIEDIGGKYNANVLINSLSGFDTAISATETALNSAGSAQEEFDKSLDSINKKAEAVQGAFQELVWGDGGLNSFIKLILDATTSVLKFADSGIGKSTIGLATFATSIKLITILFSTFSKSAIATKLSLDLLLASSLGLKDGISLLTMSMLTNPLFIGASITVGILAIATALNEVYESTDELNSKVKELSTSTATLKSERDALSNSVDLTEGERNKLSLLNAQIKANEILIQQEYEKASASRDYEESSPSVFENGIKHVKTDETDVNTALSSDTEELSIGQLIEAYDTLDKAKATSLDQDEDIIAKKAELIEALSQEGLNLLDLKDKGIELTDSDQKRLESILDVTGALSSQASTSDAVVDATEEETESMDVASDSAKTYSEQADEILSSVSEMVGSFDTLNDALAEQSEQGQLSADTILSLIDSGYAMALSFDEQTGACTLNKDAMITLTQAKIADKIATMELAQTEIAEKLKSDGIAAYESAKGFLALAKAKADGSIDIVNIGGNKISNEDVDAYNELEAGIKALENTADNLDSTFSGVSSSSGGASDALKEQKDAMSDLKSQYDTAIDVINNQIDKYVDKLEESKDNALDAIDEQIDALEEAKDEELDSIDERIDKLEKLKDKKLELIQDEIDAYETLSDETEDYYDNLLDDIEEQNEATEESIKLQELQDALTSAKQQKVMVLEGGEFVYKTNLDAVASAQKELDEYQLELKAEAEVEAIENSRDEELAIYEQKIADLQAEYDATEELYDKKIAKLESHREQVEEEYDQQIKDLENYREQVEEQYDAQIEYYNNFKDQFAEMTEEYSNQQDMLMANQLTGIDLENTNWLTRLSNLKNFVSNYNALLAQIKTASTTSSSSSSSSSSKTSSHANGVASVGSDEIALVGENPNTELIIGSKANGTLMNLAKGSGVVNAESTSTFAGLINTLGKYGSINGSIGGVSSNTSNSNKTTNITQNISLPSVTDGNSFVEAMKNFKTSITQEAYAR